MNVPKYTFFDSRTIIYESKDPFDDYFIKMLNENKYIERINIEGAEFNNSIDDLPDKIKIQLNINFFLYRKSNFC